MLKSMQGSSKLVYNLMVLFLAVGNVVLVASGQSMAKIAKSSKSCHQACLSSKWSFIKVVSHQGGRSSGWLLIRVVIHQGCHSLSLVLKVTRGNGQLETEWKNQWQVRLYVWLFHPNCIFFSVFFFFNGWR